MKTFQFNWGHTHLTINLLQQKGFWKDRIESMLVFLKDRKDSTIGTQAICYLVSLVLSELDSEPKRIHFSVHIG